MLYLRYPEMKSSIWDHVSQSRIILCHNPSDDFTCHKIVPCWKILLAVSDEAVRFNGFEYFPLVVTSSGIICHRHSDDRSTFEPRPRYRSCLSSASGEWTTFLRKAFLHKNFLEAMTESTEDLLRKIEQLKLQIAQKEAEALHQQSAPLKPDNAAEEYDEEEYYEEEFIEDEDEHEQARVQQVGTPSPLPTEPSSKPVSTPTRTVDPHPSVTHKSHVEKMEQLKRQHGFERPDWATQADTVADKAILDESIDHGLKQAGKAGQYQRQVKEAVPVIVKGAHVAPKQKVEPRLTWIVVNVNKRKVGKIVMHLYGKDVHTIVDNFVELKGFELERRDGGLAVVGINPPFLVTPGGKAGLDGKDGVFGVIQEGQDIFQQVLAADANAVLSIKQAHIYPVKVGKV